MKWAKILGIFAFVGLVLSKSYDLIFNPTIFGDEGYYLGATKAILNGDWFLRHYNFDKPFLVAYAPIPGILIFGENPLGFRFVSIVAYLLSGCFFFQAIETLRPNLIRNLLATFTLFSIPLMHTHGISLFCEPYITLGLTWLLKELISGGSAARVANAFCFGFFAKYNFMLWAPMVFLKKKTWHEGIEYTKELFKKSKFWLGFFFAFTLMNATKTASLTYLLGFLKLNVGIRSNISLLERVSYWTSLLYHQLPSAVSIIFIAVFCFGAFRAFQKRSLEWRMLWIPFFIHFAVIVYTGAAQVERYLVVWLPAFFVGLILGLSEVENILKVPKKITQGATLVLLGAAFIGSFKAERSNIGGSPEMGRTLYVFREELNRPQVLVHIEPLWESTAFRDRAFPNGCTEPKCLQGERRGSSLQPFQYLIQNHEIYRGALQFSNSCLNRVNTDSLHLNEVASEVLAGLRMGRSFEVVGLNEEPDLHAHPHIDGFNSWMEGAHLIFEARPIKEIPFYGKNLLLKIEGQLFVNELRDAGVSYNRPRNTLGFMVNKVTINGSELTDFIMPLFFNGYSVRLGNLDIDWKENQILHLMGREYFLETVNEKGKACRRM